MIRVIKETSRSQPSRRPWVTTTLLVFFLITVGLSSVVVLLDPGDPNDLQGFGIFCAIIGVLIARIKGKSGLIGGLIGLAGGVILGVVLYTLSAFVMLHHGLPVRKPHGV